MIQHEPPATATTSSTPPSSAAEPSDGPVLLFDGVCHLCHGTVQFVIDRDRKRRFRFAPLQSPAGQRLLQEHGLPADQLDTMVLIADGRAHLRSSAALRVALRLPFPWPLCGLFLLVPPPIRNFFYNLVARRRYRWFGREESCRLPSAADRSRFLFD